VTEVMSVLGPIGDDALGVTMTHEHIFNDASSWGHRTSSVGWDPGDLAARPVSEDILWDLRHDPFANDDNCRLDDLQVAIDEVQRFADLGGRTIVEATGLGVGRDLAALADVSRSTGVTIIAGTGYYLDPAIPADVRDLSPEQIAETIVADLSEGESGVRPGIIGEIGVGAEFTAAERASLTGACIAQRETELPMQIHMPGWFRLGDSVLDVVESHGVDPARVVLCHMGPSGADLEYQERLLKRGVFLQYDMLGMDVFYADQGVQCPSDEQNAAWLTRLVERGHVAQLLLSQDVFLKSLLRCHGGPGYGHVLQYFVPRLLAAGLDAATVELLMVANPRALFAGATQP
jgi:phosphotriesterase-related protein